MSLRLKLTLSGGLEALVGMLTTSSPIVALGIVLIAPDSARSGTSGRRRGK